MATRAPRIETPRLILREWTAADREPFARLNADGRVMGHFPSVLTTEESDAMADRIEANLERRGFGLFAAELRTTGRFIGFIGLSVPRFEAYFTPCVEIGWRIAFDCWGQGLATEAALAVLEYAFSTLGIETIFAGHHPSNDASRRVLGKLGFEYVGDEFYAPSGVVEPIYDRRKEDWRSLQK